MKRGNNIKNKTNNTNSATVRFKKLNSEELKRLVLDYKQGDSTAVETICKSFAPLINRLAHRQFVYNSYGEDAENMLWLWLLEFITTYEGDNFRMLPGLIRRHLICKLMRTAEQNSRRWNTEQTVDLCDPAYTNIADKNDVLRKEILYLAIKQALDILPKKQRYIIRRFYLEQASQGEIAKALNCTTRAVRLQQNAALKSIRRNFISS